MLLLFALFCELRLCFGTQETIIQPFSPRIWERGNSNNSALLVVVSNTSLNKPTVIGSKDYPLFGNSKQF